jgi:hypothetical protein
MKRFFLPGLALLLVLSSLGHALAAAFCPRALGRECCFAKTTGHTHSLSSRHEKMAGHDMHMNRLSIDSMNTDDTAIDATSMDHMAMNDVMIDAATVAMSTTLSPPAFTGEAVVNKLDQPFDSCTHCLGHSGIVNAPVSFVSVSNQTGKEIRSVLLPGLRFPVRPAIALAQIGLLREHAPPGMSARRHILISVFLI